MEIAPGCRKNYRTRGSRTRKIWLAGARLRERFHLGFQPSPWDFLSRSLFFGPLRPLPLSRLLYTYIRPCFFTPLPRWTPLTGTPLRSSCVSKRKHYQRTRTYLHVRLCVFVYVRVLFTPFAREGFPSRSFLSQSPLNAHNQSRLLQSLMLARSSERLGPTKIPPPFMRNILTAIDSMRVTWFVASFVWFLEIAE